MNRRNFGRLVVGSLLGSVTGASFLALTDDRPWQRVALPYRMLFKHDYGRWFQATAVTTVEPVDARNAIPGKPGTAGWVAPTWKFLAEPLLVA